jgi:pimeloyl-ACP methyl ester carboxylesterase
LFIHGGGTPGAVYADDLAELAGDCRLITYDRRGYGASGTAASAWREHMEDAADLLESLDAAPATVAGYSAGAIVALDLALERAELVAAVVLLDPAVHSRRHATPGLIATYVSVQMTRRLRGERAGAERWLRYLAGDAWDRMPDALRETMLSSAAGLFADLGCGDGDHLDAARLEHIDVPVTIVGCELSPPFLRRSVAALEEAMPQARCVSFARSGHALFVDARDQALDCLRGAVLAWPG